MLSSIDHNTCVLDSSILQDLLDLSMCREEECVRTTLTPFESLGETSEFVTHDEASSFFRFVVSDELHVRLRLALFIKENFREMSCMLDKKINFCGVIGDGSWEWVFLVARYRHIRIAIVKKMGLWVVLVLP